MRVLDARIGGLPVSAPASPRRMPHPSRRRPFAKFHLTDEHRLHPLCVLRVPPGHAQKRTFRRPHGLKQREGLGQLPFREAGAHPTDVDQSTVPGNPDQQNADRVGAVARAGASTHP